MPARLSLVVSLVLLLLPSASRAADTGGVYNGSFRKTVAGGERRWVPLSEAAGMPLTGLARKVLARAHLLPTPARDAIVPELDSMRAQVGLAQ